MSHYAKALASLSSALGVAATVAADGSLSASDWITILMALLGAGTVYAVPNGSKAPKR